MRCFVKIRRCITSPNPILLVKLHTVSSGKTCHISLPVWRKLSPDMRSGCLEDSQLKDKVEGREDMEYWENWALDKWNMPQPKKGKPAKCYTLWGRESSSGKVIIQPLRIKPISNMSNLFTTCDIPKQQESTEWRGSIISLKMYWLVLRWRCEWQKACYRRYRSPAWGREIKSNLRVQKVHLNRI